MSTLLKPADVAKLLQISRPTLRRWMKSGVLPRPQKLGRLLRWDPETLGRWLAGGCKRVVEENRVEEPAHA